MTQGLFMISLFHHIPDNEYMLYEHDNFEVGINIFKKAYRDAYAWYDTPITGNMVPVADEEPTYLSFMDSTNIQRIADFADINEYKLWIADHPEYYI